MEAIVNIMMLWIFGFLVYVVSIFLCTYWAYKDSNDEYKKTRKKRAKNSLK